jgi:hypothetical protein
MNKSTFRAALEDDLKSISSVGQLIEAIEVLRPAASMLEKLLPGEDGEFSEELIERVAQLLATDFIAFSDLTYTDTHAIFQERMQSMAGSVLQAIVDTLTDTKDS